MLNNSFKTNRHGSRTSFERPDYKKWLDYDYWNIEDFASLLVEIDPNTMIYVIASVEDMYKLNKLKGGISPLANHEQEAHLIYENYKDYLTQLRRSKLFQNIEKQATPQKCLEWASNKDISMPSPLMFRIDIKKNEKSTRAITNSFNKLQKAFAALCKDKYDFDNDPGAMSKIISSMDRGGFSLDDQTIRKHFKEGLNKIEEASR